MPVNHYFQSGNTSGTTGEQNLIENLIIESMKIYGHDVYYLPRTSMKHDAVLGEDVLSQFTQSFPLEMYLNNIQGWEGNSELMSKFGIQVTDQATFVVSKRRWEDEATLNNIELQLPLRPAEGDLLFFPKTKAFFEIKYVQHLDPFFQLGKFYVYSMQCELYQYSSEHIITGNEEVDVRAVEKSRDQYNHLFLLQSGGVFQSQAGGPIILESYVTDAEPFDDTDNFLEEAHDGIVDFDVVDPFGVL